MKSTIKVRAAKQKIINCTHKCVMRTGSELVSYANLYMVPIRSGLLQSSGFVESISKNANSVSALVSYGKPQGLRGENPYANVIHVSDPVSAGGDIISKQRTSYGGLTYALDVHEKDYHYNYGRRWHYLQDAVMQRGEWAFLIGIQEGFK